jgi:hypothetical protein
LRCGRIVAGTNAETASQMQYHYPSEWVNKINVILSGYLPMELLVGFSVKPCANLLADAVSRHDSFDNERLIDYYGSFGKLATGLGAAL